MCPTSSETHHEDGVEKQEEIAMAAARSFLLVSTVRR